MRVVIITLCSLLSGVTVCGADLLVYEPFDYQVHNHEVQGRLEGRNGGRGFAEPWLDTAGEEGYAFIYDQRGNPEKLYGGQWGQGNPSWDGVVDNLPTLGGYMGVSDWDRSGSVHATRKLAQSAGAMAKENGGVLWLSAVWHMPNHTFFAPVGIALASNKSGFKERAILMNDKADAIGVGNGKGMRERKSLNPIIWKAGVEVAGTAGAKIDSKKDNIIIIKFEFGAIDKVSTWYFTEDQQMTEEAFNQQAVSCTSDVDENTLEYLALGAILRENAIDEIRIGRSFKSIISGTIPARQEVKVTKTTYDSKGDAYSVEMTTNPGEVYGLFLSEVVAGYKPCVASCVEAAKDKNVTTFGPFPNPKRGQADLKFEIGLPDVTPPTIQRVWGGGTKISLLFSEVMVPATALSPSNYKVADPRGQQILVQAARFDSDTGAVTLMTKEPLKPATAYTVTTCRLTDLANLPLSKESIVLRTWDDDPKGVKVFILSGQSNMVGYGHTEKGQHGDGGPGTLRYLAVHDSEYLEFAYRSLLVDPAQPATSAWKTLGKVKLWWRNGGSGKLGGPIFKGNLGPLTSNGMWFGPEYGFGQVVADYYRTEDVLIIKPAWGGHALVSDFRSPEAVAKRGGRIGASYVELFENTREVLDKLGTEFPEWKGRGYQIAGFAWHQGTSDKSPAKVAEEYKESLPDFIRSVRSEFAKPDLPFVIATTGMNNAGPVEPPPYKGYHPVEKAQLWVAGVEKPANVLTDDTRGYYEQPDVSPRNQGFHWNGNARSYFRVGYGLGTNMVTLLQSR